MVEWIPWLLVCFIGMDSMVAGLFYSVCVISELSHSMYQMDHVGPHVEHGGMDSMVAGLFYWNGFHGCWFVL